MVYKIITHGKLKIEIILQEPLFNVSEETGAISNNSTFLTDALKVTTCTNHRKNPTVLVGQSMEGYSIMIFVCCAELMGQVRLVLQDRL
jgi:hypothetical protein